MYLKKISDLSPYVLLGVFMSILLQVQVNLFAETGYAGLRVGLADLFLPIIGLFVLLSLCLRRSRWPDWSVRYFWLWLLALVFVMSASLLNGLVVTGEISNWALVNKYAGFFILISYVALGGWIATNVKDVKALYSVFALCYSAFLVLCVWLSIVAFFIDAMGGWRFWIASSPWDGGMANRNAFMVVFVLAMAFILHSYAKDGLRIPRIVQDAFWACLPTFLLFNCSRTGWIFIFVLFLGFLLFSLRKPYLKRVLLFSFLGILLGFLSFSVTDERHDRQVHQFDRLTQLTIEGVDGVHYGGDRKRLIAIEDGLELYQRYDPLVGAGLGSYKPFQIEKRGQFVEIIDFTALWLLVEMGVVGLTVFIAFFIVCAVSLYKDGYKSRKSNYHRAVFVFLILFAGMTLLHELMYMRILWFVMGMALVSGRDKAHGDG